jgi:DNA-binding CsgD family transcriptional regulator
LETAGTTPTDYLRNLANQLKPSGGLGMFVLVPDGPTAKTRRLLITTHPGWESASHDLLQSHFASAEDPKPFDATIRTVKIDRATPGHAGWVQASIGCIGIISHVLPAGRTIDVLVPALKELYRDDLAAIARLINSNWYGLKHYVFRPLSGITQQQGRVLELALEGFSAKETADAMGLSERTINHHLTQLQARLGTNGKTQSIVKAIWLGAL